MALESKQITFHYRYPEDYVPVYVNGTYGGLSPQGEIVAHFFLEQSGLPQQAKHTLNADGSLGPELDRGNPLDSMERVIQTGIVMNIENAKRIHEWLGQKIQELETHLQPKGK